MNQQKTYSCSGSFRKLNIVLLYVLFIAGCVKQEVTVQKLSVATGAFSTIKIPDTSRFNHIEFILHTKSKSPVVLNVSPNGYDFRGYNELAASVTDSTMSAEKKAMALWQFTSDWVYYCAPAVRKQFMYDPLKMLNSFGCGICGGINATLANLFSVAGIPSRVYSLEGHVVAEAFYNGAWHMFDADQHLYFTNDSGQVADVEYISNHTSKLNFTSKQNHPYGNLWFMSSLMKRIYQSKSNNYVSEIYTSIPFDFKPDVTLNKNDQLKFSIHKLTGISRYEYFYKVFSNPSLKAEGTLYRSYTSSSLFQESHTAVVKEHLPYAVKNITVSGIDVSSLVEVYYSPDSINWYFRGTLSPPQSEVQFKPFGLQQENMVFSYYLKLTAIDKASGDNYIGDINIESAFLFNNKVLVNDSASFIIFSESDTANNNILVNTIAR